jgi:hypothetical protein
MYYTPETLLNHVFEDLRKTKAPNSPLGPDYFEEAVFYFLVQSKRDFNKEVRLRSYDNKREDWPKCMHGEDCLVQIFVEGGLMEVGVSSDVLMHM